MKRALVVVVLITLVLLPGALAKEHLKALPHADLIEQEMGVWGRSLAMQPESARAMDRPDPNELVRVVITIKEPEELKRAGKTARKMAPEQRKQLGKSMRAYVTNERGVNTKHLYNSFNGMSAEIPVDELSTLREHPLVKSVELDERVEAYMSDTAPLLNADDVWRIMIDGENITGAGQTVCIIDTGIDYTHESLGGCSYAQKNHEGTEEALAEPVESPHDYPSSYDNTWTITKPGYENIAVHFNVIITEDGWDFVHVYDADMREVATYSGTHINQWSPSVPGDTIHVRLASDGIFEEWGFLIDKTLNGTTNTTADWDSCGKIAGGWDIINSDADLMDDQGHGTHVAGTVAGNGTVKGIAPDATLLIVKGLDSDGSGWASEIAAGIEWCNAQADEHNVSAISLSLGGGLFSSACTSSYYGAPIAAAVANNISVVVAAGNDGNHTHISSPACIAGTTVVASTTKTDGISSFSNRNQLVSIAAPGSSIVSAALGGGTMSNSGTSMATPHVSGAIALLTQYWQALDVNHTPEEMESLLAAHGAMVYDSASQRSYSRIDVLNATDVRAPITTDDAPSGWINTSVNITLDATDETDINHTSFRIAPGAWENGTLVEAGSEGTIIIEYYSVDWFNNTEETRSATVSIDLSTPSTTDDAPTGWQTTDITITLNATDGLSGVNNTYCRINDAQWESTNECEITTDGTHNITYYSVDNAGNTEDVVNVSVKRDAIPPNTTDDEDGAWKNQSYTVTLSSIDATSGVNSTYLRHPNGTWEKTISIIISASGENNYNYFSEDNAGNNETQRTFTTRIDPDAPSTTSDAPESWSAEPATITFTAVDALSGINHTGHRLNDGDWQNGTSMIINESGNHTISFYSEDRAGNIETMKNATVLIDRDSPNMNFSLSEGPYGVGENLTVTAIVNDTYTLANITFSGSPMNISSNGTYSMDLELSMEGNVTITVVAEDAAGNQATVSSTVQVRKKLVVDQTFNTSTRIDAKNSLNATLIVGLNTTRNGTITLLSSTQSPQGVNARARALRYLDIDASSNVTDSLANARIELHYDATEVAGLDPDTLKISWYNTTSEEWTDLSEGDPSFVIGAGHDTTERTVWVNVTHFSTYVLSGDEPSETISTGSSGGGGGGGGGGAAAVTETGPSDEITLSWTFISEGQRLSRTFNKSGLPIISFDAIAIEDRIKGSVRLANVDTEREGYIALSGFTFESADDLPLRNSKVTIKEEYSSAILIGPEGTVGIFNGVAILPGYGAYGFFEEAPAKAESQPEPALAESMLEEVEEEVPVQSQSSVQTDQARAAPGIQLVAAIVLVTAIAAALIVLHRSN